MAVFINYVIICDQRLKAWEFVDSILSLSLSLSRKWNIFIFSLWHWVPPLTTQNSRMWGAESLSTRLPQPTLLHARYRVNLQKKYLHILIFICILITTYANQTPLCGFKKNTEKNGVPFSLCSELAQFRLRKQLTRNRYSKIWRLNREILHLDIWQRYTIF